MNIYLNVILAILVFLAVSAGVTKIILIPQDVELFGNYGFTNPILISYGAVQVIGALIVAITFLISAVVLIMAKNIPVTIITFVAVLMLGVIMKQSLKRGTRPPARNTRN